MAKAKIADTILWISLGLICLAVVTGSIYVLVLGWILIIIGGSLKWARK